jgi:Family of unknown function (DUF6188)
MPSLPATGPWTLPVEGFEVLSIVFAFPIDVVAYGNGGPSCRMRLAGAFALSEPEGTVHFLDAERQSWQELAVVLSLRHDKLVTALVTETAQLTVTFASGRSLTAEPDDRPYEHWEVTGPDFKLIAMPGDGSDGVAIFGS